MSSLLFKRPSDQCQAHQKHRRVLRAVETKDTVVLEHGHAAVGIGIAHDRSQSDLAVNGEGHLRCMAKIIGKRLRWNDGTLDFQGYVPHTQASHALPKVSM